MKKSNLFIFIAVAISLLFIVGSVLFFFMCTSADLRIYGDPASVMPLYVLRNSKAIISFASARGWTADGYTYQAWKLHGSEEEIAIACSPSNIKNRIVWFNKNYSSENERFAISIRQFQTEAFSLIKDILNTILSDEEMTFSYERFAVIPDGNPRKPYNIGIWLCSPKNKLLLFLDYKT